jgi:glutaredoxin
MEVLTWTCPHCKKILRSLYPEQLDYNKTTHLDKHYRKDKEVKNNVG